MPTSGNNLQDDAYTRVVEFLRSIDARRVQNDVPFRQFAGVKTTEVRSQLQPFQTTESGSASVPGGSGGATGGTQNMYFIDGGILYTGDFVVSNVTEV